MKFQVVAAGMVQHGRIGCEILGFGFRNGVTWKDDCEVPGVAAGRRH